MHQRIPLLACLFLAPALAAPELAAVSEKDFLAEVPVVLSVARLSQRPDETPEAAADLERQAIRRTGAPDPLDTSDVPAHGEGAGEGNARQAGAEGGREDSAGRLVRQLKHHP